MTDFPQTADVVVVGGGVIGLSVARSLALRGVRNVTLIERSSLGAESSWAAAGMLAPQAEADCADEFFHFCCRSRDMYPAFAAALLEESGIDIELETTGTLYLAFTDQDVNELEKRFGWQSGAGLQIERFDAEMAQLIEPSISQEVRAALKFPLDTVDDGAGTVARNNAVDADCRCRRLAPTERVEISAGGAAAYRHHYQGDDHER